MSYASLNCVYEFKHVQTGEKKTILSGSLVNVSLDSLTSWGSKTTPAVLVRDRFYQAMVSVFDIEISPVYAVSLSVLDGIREYAAEHSVAGWDEIAECSDAFICEILAGYVYPPHNISLDEAISALAPFVSSVVATRASWNKINRLE